MAVFARRPKNVAVIARWPYYRGGRKAGFHCNMHLKTGYSTKKVSKFIYRSLRPAGRIPWIILRFGGFSCVRDAGHRGSKITESFGATISGIVWVAKCYIWLDSGCPEYSRPIKTNAFTPKLCQKSLRPKLVARKENYKTLRRAHKFDTKNSPTVVTRMDTPKSGCHLHSKYIMGVKRWERKH